MVTYLSSWVAAAQTHALPLLAVEQKAEPLLMRLDPPVRAKVLMALLGLVLVGIGLVAITLIAGRHVVRIARASHGPTPRHEDDWYRKPLIPKEPNPPARDPE